MSSEPAGWRCDACGAVVAGDPAPPECKACDVGPLGSWTGVRELELRAHEELEEARATAFREAKAARSRELRGKNRKPTFDGRGLHAFSLEVGRIQALEELLGDRVPAEELTDPVLLRREALEAAERDFAGEVAELGPAVFERARREERGG